MGNKCCKKNKCCPLPNCGPQTQICSEHVHLWQLLNQQQQQLQLPPPQLAPAPFPDFAPPTLAPTDMGFPYAAPILPSVPFSIPAPPFPVAPGTHPVRTLHRIVSLRSEKVPVTREVRSVQPVTRTVRVQVPVQRAVHGTRAVCHPVTVNRSRVETFTRMVPVQESRLVDVPTVEQRVTHVPTVSYVTEMVVQEQQVTEMQEKVDHVTEYVTREVPVINHIVRSRYEMVRALPPEDQTGQSNQTLQAISTGPQLFVGNSTGSFVDAPMSSMVSLAPTASN